MEKGEKNKCRGTLREKVPEVAKFQATLNIQLLPTWVNLNGTFSPFRFNGLDCGCLNIQYVKASQKWSRKKGRGARQTKDRNGSKGMRQWNGEHSEGPL